MRAERIGRRAGVTFAGALGLVAVQAVAARRRAYLYDPPPDDLPTRFGNHDRHLRFVVIGDSTAVGVGAGSRARSYPVLLAIRLGQHFRVELHVLGGSGVRMAEVARELAAQAAGLNPDLVFIGVGGNDAIHFTPLRSVQAGTKRALEILGPTGAAVVVALGPRFDTPALARPLRDLAAARCRAVNRAILLAAREAGVAVADMETGVGDTFARDPKRYFSEDMFHPGPAGYEVWAEVASSSLLEAALGRLETA